MVYLYGTTQRSERDEMNIKPKTVNPIKADIWALGVCLFVMVSGQLPFLNPTDCKTTVNEQLNRQRTPIKRNISRQLTQLLDQMLEPITANRIDICGIAQHKWLFGVSDVIKIKANEDIR